MATWARMPLFLKVFTLGGSVMLAGIVVGLLLDWSWGALLLVVGTIALLVGAFTNPAVRRSGAGTDPVVDWSKGPAILIRTYSGGSNDEAVRAFQADAATLARYGYEPTSQSWAESQRGPSAGSVVMWGAFAASKRRGGGTLTVTYRRVPQGPPVAVAQVAPAGSSTGSIPEQIRALGELRDQGLLTPEEFEAKKRELLSRM